MKLILKRDRTSKWGTDGRLLIDGDPLCDTVEHPREALTEGHYRVEIRYCKDQNEPAPFLFRLDKKGSPIYRKPAAYICKGNGPMRLRNGSLIVGVRYLPGVVTRSQPTFERLMEVIGKTKNLVLTIE